MHPGIENTEVSSNSQSRPRSATSHKTRQTKSRKDMNNERPATDKQQTPVEGTERKAHSRSRASKTSGYKSKKVSNSLHQGDRPKTSKDSPSKEDIRAETRTSSTQPRRNPEKKSR